MHSAEGSHSGYPGHGNHGLAASSAVPGYPNHGAHGFDAMRPSSRNSIVAAVLAVFLGTLGVHNFYLGFTTRGVVQLLVSIIGGIFTCGMATVAIAVWGFVEGVLLLAASPSRMYDGHGVILRD